MGEIILKCLDSKKTKLQIEMQIPNDLNGLRPHPNLKRDVFNSSKILEPKSAFPHNQMLSALKYKQSLEAPFGLCTWYSHPSLTVELQKTNGVIPLNAFAI